MKRFLAFVVFVCLLVATATVGYSQTCRSVGGGGTLANDAISATTNSPITSPRQISSTGLYLGNNGVVTYLGFEPYAFGGWWYLPGSSNLLSVLLRSRTEGVFKKSTNEPTDCTPNIINPDGGSRQMYHACPHQLVLPDDCSGSPGQDEYAKRNWAAPGWYAPLNYGDVTGNFTVPGGDVSWAVPFDPTHDFAGGLFTNGKFTFQAYDTHLATVSVYPWSTPVRPGRQILIDSLRHGLTLCNVGMATNMVKAAYSSGGFSGDPNFMDYTWTIFEGGIQSYFEVTNCGYQMLLDDVGSNAYTLGPCPQVLGHVFDVDAMENIVYVESTNNVEMPEANAVGLGTGWEIGGGNSTCQNDSAHGLPAIGENWVPNDNMPAGLMARYQLYDAFLSSQWTYPGTCTTDAQGRLICSGSGQQGSEDWTDVIRNVDQNIVAVGVKDTADQNGVGGDAYWSVSYFCSQGSMCSGARLLTLFSNIMHAVMPGTSTTLEMAMHNWGLAIPPRWPNGPGVPWIIPGSVAGNVLSMIAPHNGKHTSNNIEAQQGNYAIIGGVMFNAQPNPPGTTGAPAIADPTPAGVSDGSPPIAGFGTGLAGPGGDAPSGSPVP